MKTLIGEPVRNLQSRFASIRLGDAVMAFGNIELLSEMTPLEWYRHIRWLRERFPEKVVIGRIMGDARAQ